MEAVERRAFGPEFWRSTVTWGTLASFAFLPMVLGGLAKESALGGFWKYRRVTIPGYFATFNTIAFLWKVRGEIAYARGTDASSRDDVQEDEPVSREAREAAWSAAFNSKIEKLQKRAVDANLDREVKTSVQEETWKHQFKGIANDGINPLKNDVLRKQKLVREELERVERDLDRLRARSSGGVLSSIVVFVGDFVIEGLFSDASAVKQKSETDSERKSRLATQKSAAKKWQGALGRLESQLEDFERSLTSKASEKGVRLSYKQTYVDGFFLREYT